MTTRQPGSPHRYPAWVLWLVLSACSTPACNANDPKTAMLGISTSEALTCLGTPPTRTVTGGAEVWNYVFGACMVHTTMTDGHLRDVNYTVASTKDLSLDEQCQSVPDVSSCVRWVRNPSLFYQEKPLKSQVMDSLF